MEIYLSQFAGFCDGVRRAYEMVFKLDLEKVRKPIFILGALVHNPDVMEKIEQRGIKKISAQDFFSAQPGEIGTLILTAHGVGPEIFRKAKEKGIEVVDTACPKVIKDQRLAEVYSKRGYKIILIGDQNHKEVNGIDAWAGGNSTIISNEKDWPKIKFNPKDKIVILSQTTQSEDFFQKTADFIKAKNPLAEAVFTICHATSERQGEIIAKAALNDAVVIIGSKESANSSRLFEIALKHNPRSYFIENEKELEKNWFRGVKKVLVSAGASTPEWTIKEVVRKLSQE